jgi:hypothetical protein
VMGVRLIHFVFALRVVCSKLYRVMNKERLKQLGTQLHCTNSGL